MHSNNPRTRHCNVSLAKLGLLATGTATIEVETRGRTQSALDRQWAAEMAKYGITKNVYLGDRGDYPRAALTPSPRASRSARVAPAHCVSLGSSATARHAGMA